MIGQGLGRQADVENVKMKCRQFTFVFYGFMVK